MSALDDFLDRPFFQGFRDRYGEGREDYRLSYYAGRLGEDKEPEGTRLGGSLGTNPTFTTTRDLLGISRPSHKRAREDAGMGLSEDRETRYGQIFGTLANDVTQDHTRSLWWLLNASQAVGNVVAEAALSKANPDLYKYHTKKFADFEETQMDELGKTVRRQRGIPKVEFIDDEVTKQKVLKPGQKNERAYELALREGFINKDGVRQKGVSLDQYGRYQRRKYDPGDVASLLIPTGVAINAGLGLLNPLGGSGGYTAALPSQDDLTKTSNVIGEVGMKYFLGRTGNLLPYEEFSKYRPDVGIDEYNRYKAFKYDKELDFDPRDGNLNLLPGGALKYTNEGIHGPEVQFLGRSLPATTTLVPYLGALAGGVLGVRNESPDKDGVKRRRPIKRGLMGGLAGLGIGTATGLIAEEMRRRASSNNVQLEGGNAEPYLR